ncbi:hypothetical protein AGMMS49921_13370 [Endomicrobiia bacterium]|nr:hypothetical protein AGMMS49921_13370 [Endomicrobiia bacterium]
MKKQKLEIRKIRPYMKNVLAIIAMFACTSVCLGGNTKILDSSNALMEGVSLVILINRMEPVMMLAIFR